MIKIAFYWHQHQPYYKDSITGEYFLPWVRLHGIKDYIGMVLLLKEFPEMRQTFNYVPCLLEQLSDYEKGYTKDRYWKLAEKPVEDLTEEEKYYILDNFYSANHQHMIDVYPRYRELLKKRNFRRKRAQDVINDFSNNDFQDLQVWANLTWYHPLIIKREPILSEIVIKGKGFSNEDKKFVLSKQMEIIKQIIPLHKQLQDSNQIEITTSPFYHPILPLLCDQESAKVALPKIRIPSKRLIANDDAKMQIEMAVQAYEKYFGRKPCGMWPSEGAVSDDIIPLVANAGFNWLASDEEILANTLDKQITRDKYGDVIDADILYKPYRISVNNNAINIVFRDHNLSDLIGFQYSKYSSDVAVSDFINRINSLKKYKNNKNPFLVTIILDGENAWEHYPNNGLDFLMKLYEEISKDSDLECVRISDYLREYPSEQTLNHIYPGSWIGHNLATWIGHEEKNRAWELIEQTRSFLHEHTNEKNNLNGVKCAWEEIFIAEGSDWFWWFGDDHFTPHKHEFDNLFRLHLKNVYRMLNIDSPKILEAPITKIGIRRVYTSPKRFLNIKLDGVVSNYFEWHDAGIYSTEKDFDTMHRTYGQYIKNVYYGFDIDNLFVRLDFGRELLPQFIEDGKLIITFIQPSEVQVYISEFLNRPLNYVIKGKNCSSNEKRFYSVFFDKIFELSCSFKDLGFFSGTSVEFFIDLVKDCKIVQRVPINTTFCFSVPTEEFERIMWQV
ncbi:MAG TPA: alpha-amylase/alpha-mannosidase [Candidatus Wujingus californicus]|uniref:alpha-amylase/alpha-mannosidase n=1 Tax=Candidatus Wujingus californicus TaxID=3367618 RepID=UPI004029EE71